MLFGTALATATAVTIGVPVMNGRVSPVLDTAVRLLLVTRRHGEEIARRELLLEQLSTEELAQKVAELGVDVLLCAGVSETLLRALEARGVRVEEHVCGNVDEVLVAFSCGKLWQAKFRMPGCWGGIGGRWCCRRHRRRSRHGPPGRIGTELSDHDVSKP